MYISVIHIIYHNIYIYIHIRVLVVISSDQDLHQDSRNGRLLIGFHSGLFGHEILPKKQWELWWYNDVNTMGIEIGGTIMIIPFYTSL